MPSDDVMSTPSNSSIAAVLYSESASPQESKPAPILALVAGTLTVIIRSPLFRHPLERVFAHAHAVLGPRLGAQLRKTPVVTPRSVNTASPSEVSSISIC
ncbi:MAG: hypothetical protein V8T36_08170 [Ruthenibacterium lactatiformans]